MSQFSSIFFVRNQVQTKPEIAKEASMYGTSEVEKTSRRRPETIESTIVVMAEIAVIRQLR
jgi:hypothetical protein